MAWRTLPTSRNPLALRESRSSRSRRNRSRGFLSAALAHGSFLKGLLGFSPEGKKQPYHLGHFFIAINIEAFIDPADFKHTVGEILRGLRASRKAPGKDRIYTAGEKEYINYCKRQSSGVPINRALQKNIIDLQKDYDLSGYSFEFAKDWK